jgi:glycosyltransferase involved in cell wall biosynthesis
MLDQITPLILTYNEAPNIARTLEQLRWARDIVVVDSFSTDETLEIASSFPQVRVSQRVFDSHASQWTFGLSETRITTEWVLALDADYVLTNELLLEVEALAPDPDVKGYRARFVYCVNGKRLISGIYPPVSMLYRRRDASYVQDGHTHKLVLEGRVENLHSPVLHDDRKPFSRWLEAQSRYTKLEADKLHASTPESLTWTDRVRCWRIVAPAAMLLYCLIIRGGIFDGWGGFYYAFQRTLAELMLSLYLIDHDLRGARGSKQEQNQPRMNADQTDLKSDDARKRQPEAFLFDPRKPV